MRIAVSPRLLLPLLALVALPLLSRPLAGSEPPTPTVSPLTNASFTDLAGVRHAIRAAADLPAVFVFLSTECPISNRYTRRVAALASEFGPRGVHFFAVYPNDTESAEAVRKHAGEYGIAFPVVRDDGTLTRLVGAAVTPEAALVDAGGALRYRGRIDDNTDTTRVTSHDLAAAIRAVLAGRAPAASRTRAFGCLIHVRGVPTTPGAVRRATTAYSYARDIAPILQQRCLSCHRTGEIGPMPLDGYERAVAWAQEIKRQVVSQKMPPWHAHSHGEYLDDPHLTRPQIAAIASWADGGTPLGDPKEIPPTPAFRKGWTLGTPDAILEMPEEYSVPAEGRDIYRCFVLKNPFPEDRWVSGVEYAPGNRAVVHHASCFLDTTGQARRMAEAANDGAGYANPTPGNGPGYFPIAGQLGGWTPGHMPRRLPPGVGILLPKGADIVLEVHYHPTGKPEKDRTRFGLFFAREEVRKQLRLADVSNTTFHIPAGDGDYRLEFGAFTPVDMTVLSVTPHFHNLGRSMHVTATLPDGTTLLLVSVHDWDFRWQPSYRFKEPVKLPRRTRIDIVAHFDNSAANSNNPHRPPRDVVWGESTDDEMCTLFMAYTRDDEDLRNEPVLVPAAR